MKKILSLVLVISLVLGSFVPVFADSNEYGEQGALLESLGVLKGSDGDLRLNDKLTRQELMVMTARLMGEEATAENFKFESPFPDVDHPYFEPFIAWAYNKGLTTGYPDGTFGPTDEVSVQMLQTFLLRVLGYAGDWATAPEDAVEAGIMGDIEANGDLSRGLMSALVVNTLEADMADESETLAASLDIEMPRTIIAYKEVDLGTVANGAALELPETVTVLFDNGTEDDLAVAWDAYDTTVAGDLTIEGIIEGTDLVVTAIVTVGAADLAVASVEADNNIQVEITFNNAVDEDTAEDAGNYSEDSATINIDSVQLVDSNKVVVTFNAAFADQDDVTITLNDIKDVNGKVIAEDTEVDVTFFDVHPPKVEKAESTGPDTFMLTFSEPVEQITAELTTNYSVNDGQYFIQSASRTSLTTVEITLYSTLPEGEHEITITGVKDLAGYKVTETAVALNQAKDSDAPYVVEIEKASPQQVVLVFNENVSLTDSVVNLVAADAIYHTNTLNDPDNITVSNNKVTLTFTNNPLPKGGTAYLVIDEDTFADGWANKNADYSANIAVTVDETKPVVEKVEAVNDAKIKVTFSEDIDAAEAADYIILDSTGEEVSVTITAAYDLDDALQPINNIVILTFGVSEHLNGGINTVVVDDVKDLAANELDKISVPFAVTDTTAPSVKDIDDTNIYTFDGTLYADKQIVKISFDEPMAVSGPGSVLDLGNYLYGAQYLSDISKVTVTLTDSGKAVLIDFSNSAVTVSDTNTITVGKVADVSGNYMSSFTTNVTVLTPGTIGIKGVEAVGTKTIEVTLKDALTKFAVNDFILKQSGATITPASVTFKNVDGEGIITYTLASANELATDPQNTITVETVAGATYIDSVNAFGIKVEDGAAPVTASDGIAPVVEKTYDHDANASTADVENVRIAGTTVTIEFSEDLNPNTLSTLTFSVEGYKVTGIALNALDASIVELTVSATVSSPSATPKVTQNYDITDDSDNVFEAGTTWTARP